jgi:hypothetical protein
LNRGRAAAIDVFAAGARGTTVGSLAGAERLAGVGMRAAAHAPDFPSAASMKSARTAGGVIRLGGRGPFHALSFICGLGNRKTGDEDDAGLPPLATFSALAGDEDLAR